MWVIDMMLAEALVVNKVKLNDFLMWFYSKSEQYKQYVLLQDNIYLLKPSPNNNKTAMVTDETSFW